MGSGTSDVAALRRLDHLIWTMIAAVAAIVLAAPLVSSFHIVWPSFGAPVAACLLLVAGAWFYGNWRHDPKLASGLQCTAQVIAFAAVGAPLSYLAAGASAAFPLQDHAFDVADRALGFDWMAVLDWMNEMPTTFALLRLVYGSLTLQMALAVLCLAFAGRLLWLRTYTLAFLLAALITIVVSALLPASGVWLHYGLTEADSPHVVPGVSTVWPVFTGLRDGSVRTLVATDAEGVITFPSLHSALAVIMIAALWPIPIVRWIVLLLNVAMLAATPIDGSHYLTDVIAGVAVAAVSFVAAGVIVRRAKRDAAPSAALPRLARSD
ncbi:MAG: phosphatase PAP2 family protein [Xanthobacteraceae bacterium]